MRYILSAVLAFILFTGYGLFDMYKKLATANALADTLKASNMKLSKKNKVLKTNNKKLVAREKHIHKRITERRTKLTKTNLKKAQKKLATAGAKMAPFLGIPVVVGATAYDINEYCSNIDEMEKFEYDLFGDIALSNYDKTVCGVDIEKQLMLTANGVSNSYDNLISDFNKNTAYASVYWKQRLQETASAMSDENTQFKKYYAEQYIKTSTYLSKQNKDIAPFWKQQAIEVSQYRDKVIDFYSK